LKAPDYTRNPAEIRGESYRPLGRLEPDFSGFSKSTRRKPLGNKDPLALKRKQRCVATNYDEIDSLSAQQAGHSQYAKNLPRPVCDGGAGFIAKQPLVKGGVSCVVFGFGLLTETLFAMGQTISPPFVVAQRPVFGAAFRCSNDTAARPRRGAAVGRSDATADGRAPCRHHCAC
jgi:hypothetical protein